MINVFKTCKIEVPKTKPCCFTWNKELCNSEQCLECGGIVWDGKAKYTFFFKNHHKEEGKWCGCANRQVPKFYHLKDVPAYLVLQFSPYELFPQWNLF